MCFVLGRTSQSPMKAASVPCEGSTPNNIFYQAPQLRAVVLNLPNNTTFQHSFSKPCVVTCSWVCNHLEAEVFLIVIFLRNVRCCAVFLSVDEILLLSWLFALRNLHVQEVVCALATLLHRQACAQKVCQCPGLPLKWLTGSQRSRTRNPRGGSDQLPTLGDVFSLIC